MNYLLDTNIISEVRKGAKCDAKVAAWYDLIDDADIYLSVLVLGEIRKGVERVRPGNPAQARALEKWLATLAESFADRILPIDQAVADGTLLGEGAGDSAQGRLTALRNMLVAARDLLEGGDVASACQQLQDVADRTDGAASPPDFVRGSAAPELFDAITTLRQQLDCAD